MWLYFLGDFVREFVIKSVGVKGGGVWKWVGGLYFECEKMICTF